jgi:transcriptional regulator of acetoin/glycerol metabolism
MTRSAAVTSEDLGLRRTGEGTRKLEEMSLEEVELYLIQRTLDRFSGNVSRAAEALGLSRSAFYRRLSKYGI